MPDYFDKLKVSVHGISGGTEYELAVDSSGRILIAAGTNYIGKVRLTDGSNDLTLSSADWGVVGIGVPTIVGYAGSGTIGPLRTDVDGRIILGASEGGAGVALPVEDPVTGRFGIFALAYNDGNEPSVLRMDGDDLRVYVDGIAAGDNNIGNVDIASIAAGTNRIGKVNITDDTNDLILFKDGDSTSSKAAVLIAGANGTTAQHIRVDASGELQVDVNNAIDISDDYTRQLGIVKVGDGTDTLDVIKSGDAIGVGTGGVTAFGSDSGTARPVHVDTAGDLQVDVLTLPATAATTAKQDTIIGHLDGVEGLLTTIDADTGAIVGHVDGIETLLTTIDSRVDGVESLLTTIDADTSSLAELVKAEDTAHVSGDKGVMALAVRDDITVADAVDGDYVPLRTNGIGHLRTVDGSFFQDENRSGAHSFGLIDCLARNWSLLVVKGTATTWEVKIEASNDGSHWETILSHTNASPGEGVHADASVYTKLRRYWRVNTISANGTISIYACATLHS